MSSTHLRLFRIVLGVYLFQHFAHLVPYSVELFSRDGVFPNASSLPAFGVFPNPLFFWDSPFFAISFVLILFALSVLLIFGVQTRLVALLCWFGWACLLSRAPFISNPSIPFIGLLLLGLAALSSDWSSGTVRACSRYLWGGVWIIMAVTYTVSGVHKLGSPSWIDGSALAELTANPLARDYFFTDFLRALPFPIVALFTWGALTLEIFFAPLSVLTKIRVWAWLGMVGMHLGILFMVSFADLTAGMLLVHLFTFDERWIPARLASGESPVIFFDGNCVMCNRLALNLIELDERIKLAPLNGETFINRIPEEIRKILPDSIVYLAANGTVRTRSDAVIEACADLGGILAALAFLAKLCPRVARDFIYDQVARIRYWIFGKTKDVCDLIPGEVRARLLP